MSLESKNPFNIMSGVQTKTDAKVRSNLFSIFTINLSRRSGFALIVGRRALAWLLISLMIPLGVGDLFAQSAPPPPPPDQEGAPQAGADAPPPQNYNALSPDQLNQLVAPIALYPDSLVAQILAASTFPTEVVEADRFVQSHPGVSPDQLGPMVDGMQWDPSVKALVAFPTVLANLDKNLDWTSQLGNAYYNQPQDVMAAVQVMRQRAYEAGNLRTNQQLDVNYQPNNIVIAPANPAVVYVPYYNPWVVYGAPVVAYPVYYAPPPPPGFYLGVGLAIGFGVGIALASWNHWGWGWHNWGCGWGSRTIVYNRNVYISRSTTVINHGYYGRFDRNPAARNYNRTIAARAPNYRNFNRTTVNNYNRNSYNRGVNNYNRGANNYNRGANANRPVNSYARPNNTANRPSNNFGRPGSSQNFNRPTGSRPNNVSRPTGNNNFNRPTNNVRRPTSAPQSRPHSAPQSHSQSRPESHGNDGGHPHK